MTRKDYIALAAALSESRRNHAEGDPAREAQWEQDIQYVADVLEDDNVLFDRDRFIKACEA